MDMSDEKIQSEISLRESEIERTQTRINGQSIPENRYAIAYYSMGLDAMKISLYHLVKGDFSASQRWFERATTYYIERVRKGQEFREELAKSYWENEPLVFREAFYCAILSGSDTLQNEVAAEALAMDDAYLTEFPTVIHDFYFVRALAAIFLERDDAREFVAQLLANLDHLRPKLHAYFSALATILAGITSDDADRATEGFEQLLEYHDDDIQGTPKGPDKIVCLPAVALLVLARERGLDIEIEGEYIPESVLK